MAKNDKGASLPTGNPGEDTNQDPGPPPAQPAQLDPGPAPLANMDSPDPNVASVSNVAKQPQGPELQQAAPTVADFGSDAVKATRGKETQTFTKRAWDLLGDGDREGWKKVVSAPQEVVDLQKKNDSTV